MVVLGGAGSALGPLFGAAAFILLEEFLSGFSIYWPLGFGLILILVVLFYRGGLDGLLDRGARTTRSTGPSNPSSREPERCSNRPRRVALPDGGLERAAVRQRVRPFGPVGLLELRGLVDGIADDGVFEPLPIAHRAEHDGAEGGRRVHAMSRPALGGAAPVPTRRRLPSPRPPPAARPRPPSPRAEPLRTWP